VRCDVEVAPIIDPRTYCARRGISLRCDGCITVDTEAALKNGATKEEIAETLGVAVSVNGARRSCIPRHSRCG
jgi:hypothetical protein